MSARRRVILDVDVADPRVSELLSALAGCGTVTELPRRGAKVLVTGGARSGKSTFAESLAAEHESVTYLATAFQDPADAEWSDRIAVHRSRRPANWRTVETVDIAAVLAQGDDGANHLVLVDCLALWLTRVMDQEDVWNLPSGMAAVERRCDGLVMAIDSAPGPVVLVTNEVGSGVVPRTASGRMFRDQLGRLNAAVAAVVEDVWLCVSGVPVRIKG